MEGSQLAKSRGFTIEKLEEVKESPRTGRKRDSDLLDFNKLALERSN